MSGKGHYDWGATPNIDVQPAYREMQIGSGGNQYREAYVKHLEEVAQRNRAAGTSAASSTGVPVTSAVETGSISMGTWAEED